MLGLKIDSVRLKGQGGFWGMNKPENFEKPINPQNLEKLKNPEKTGVHKTL